LQTYQMPALMPSRPVTPQATEAIEPSSANSVM
jgi:hypothetical protein